jgi:hypothetical protein
MRTDPSRPSEDAIRRSLPRFDAARVRLDPDLQEMHELAIRGVVFAVANAGARAHALHVARPDHGAVAHRILVRQRALEDVADDFHVAVAVGAEALARLDAVFVDDTQRPEAHVPGIVVVRERKSVEGLEPAVLGQPAFLAAANLHGVASVERFH